ncbi:MAG: c-type cytochrome [Hydrogenophaga sp.]
MASPKPPRWAQCVALAAALGTLPAHASMNLALDKGCLSCHGTPPRGKAPTMAQLAADYAKHQGQEEQIQHLSSQLRERRLFGGVAAHERLSAEDAECFVRWLVGGGH